MGQSESALGARYSIGNYRVKQIKQLAEGGFSFVDLVRDENSPNTLYALKRVLCQTKEQLQGVQEEIQRHQSISHPFVLTLLASEIIPSKHAEIANAQDVLLLFPLYKHGSIVDAVSKYHAAVSAASSPAAAQNTEYPFPEEESLRLFYAIAQGLQAIHATGFAHRDLKPHNILLSYPYADMQSQSSSSSTATTAASSSSSTTSPDGSALPSEPVPIIIDLGSCSSLSESSTDRRTAGLLQDKYGETSTASYRAPEMWNVRTGHVFDEKTDVFSLGATLFFMAFGTSAFENETEGVLTLAIQAGTFSVPEQFQLENAEGEGNSGEKHKKKQKKTSTMGSSPAPPIHRSRLFSTEFVQFLKELLEADPAKRLSMKEAMKKSVILMMKALERKTTAAAVVSSAPMTANGNGVTAPDENDDDFGDFSSASPPPGGASLPKATGSPAAVTTSISNSIPSSSSSDELSDADIEAIMQEMQQGSNVSAAASASTSSSSLASPTSSASSSGAATAGFLKFGRTGTPHPCILQLDRSRSFFSYTSKGGKKNLVPFNNQRIFALITGQRTKKFQRFTQDQNYARKSHLCFSLLLRPQEELKMIKWKKAQAEAAASGKPAMEIYDDEETLDFQAENHHLFRVWTQGIQALLNKQLSLPSP